MARSCLDRTPRPGYTPGFEARGEISVTHPKERPTTDRREFLGEELEAITAHGDEARAAALGVVRRDRALAVPLARVVFSLAQQRELTQPLGHLLAGELSFGRRHAIVLRRRTDETARPRARNDAQRGPNRPVNSPARHYAALSMQWMRGAVVIAPVTAE